MSSAIGQIKGQDMGRVIAIDWGERRVGIALSDETGTIASPHSAIKRAGSLDKVLEEISGLVDSHEVTQVIFGIPLRLDGTRGPEAEGVLEVAEKLRAKVRVPVDTWDERLSTVQAERALIGGDVSRKRRKGLVDQVAASIFLQSYLDSGGSAGDGGAG
ncbi:MAG: Holliday junction resolvase RuvX [bacterium]|nr:Holliday junction resolvase RuvX [bacterium]MDT8396398.1 Holliday junction resolvase RuvX [bacterium]